nr:metallophosphoesterase [Nitratiruptor tergarcus]
MYGDIHGCLNELKLLRKKIGVTKEDIEVSVGDFIGKGQYSKETLCYLQEHSIKAIRGNHEDKFLRYYYHEQRFLTQGIANPMQLSAKEQEIYKSLDKEDFVFLQSLPLFLQFNALTVIHGGILPSTNLAKLDKKSAAQVMRVRYLDVHGRFVALDDADPHIHFWWSELYDGRYGYVVYGHQPFLYPRVDRWSFGIDTGAVYGNRLTAIVFADAKTPFCYELFDVPSQTYAKKSKPWIVSDL